MGGKKKSFNKMMSPSIPMLPSALGNKGEEFLLRRGFTQDTIKKWGLMYWLEQDAIVIPIEDVGFSRRFLSSKSKDKYKTIGGTRVSETLFGLKFFKFNGKIILLEGAFDVIWMHQLGFTNSLAILGGNLTEEQRKILIGYGGQMYFMFDKDRGGEQILEKAYGKLKRDFVIRFCYLPEGKDPNDCTMDEIRSAIKNSSVYRKEEM
jgi:DNA primase